MDAAVILVALIIVFHVSGLRVLADDGIVVRRSGIFHRSERNSLHLGGKQAFSDQPVRFVCRLLELPLLDERSEDIRERFIERTGLTRIS